MLDIIETRERYLGSASPFVNREPSWLQFNRRFLEEAENETIPIVERLKLASIFSSKLDEFFMFRIGKLFHTVAMETIECDSNDRTIIQQLDEISEIVRNHISEQHECLQDEIFPGLKEAGIFFHRLEELNENNVQMLDEYFDQEVFPILTPLSVDASHPFPFLSNLHLNLMVVFKEVDITKSLPHAFVEVPSVLPRLVPVKTAERGYHFILLEDLIRKHLKVLFPGKEIRDTFALRVTRNYGHEISENEVSEVLKSIESDLKGHSHEIAVRLEIEPGASNKTLQFLEQNLGVQRRFMFETYDLINIWDYLPQTALQVASHLEELALNPRIPQLFNSNRAVFS